MTNSTTNYQDEFLKKLEEEMMRETYVKILFDACCKQRKNRDEYVKNLADFTNLDRLKKETDIFVDIEKEREYKELIDEVLKFKERIEKENFVVMNIEPGGGYSMGTAKMEDMQANSDFNLNVKELTVLLKVKYVENIDIY